MELKNSPGMAKVEIAFIGETIQPDVAKTFVKREIAFNMLETINGNEYPRLYCMQAVGSTDKPQSDKTKMLDQFKIGDVVDVVYSISGSTKKNDKIAATANNPLCLTGFNNLSVSRIERFAQQQGYPQAGAGYPQPQYGTTQPQYQQQPNMPQPQHRAPAPAPNAAPFYPMPHMEVPKDDEGKEMVWNTKTGNWEKLPF